MKDDVAINVSGAAPQFLSKGFEEKVEIARRFGVNSIEVHPYKEWPSLLNLDGRELRRVKDAVSGLDRISVHAPMGETFTIRDEAKAAEAIQGDKASIQAAAFLGAEVVVIHVRMKHVETPEDKERAATAIRDLADYASCFGVRIAVETSTDLRRPEDLADIIRQADHPVAGVTLDTGHLLRCLSDEDKKAPDVVARYNAVLHKALDLFLQERKVFHIHMNDIRTGQLLDHYGMGLGFVDFECVIRKLIHAGYSGIFALEIQRGDTNGVSSLTDEEMRRAIDLTRQWIAKPIGRKVAHAVER